MNSSSSHSVGEYLFMIVHNMHNSSGLVIQSPFFVYVVYIVYLFLFFLLLSLIAQFVQMSLFFLSGISIKIKFKIPCMWITLGVHEFTMLLIPWLLSSLRRACPALSTWTQSFSTDISNSQILMCINLACSHFKLRWWACQQLSISTTALLLWAC